MFSIQPFSLLKLSSFNIQYYLTVTLKQKQANLTVTLKQKQANFTVTLKQKQANFTVTLKQKYYLCSWNLILKYNV